MGTDTALSSTKASVDWWSLVTRLVAAARCVLLISAAAILVAFAGPAVGVALEFQRQAVADGQWWRLFTGHLTHFGANHLAWDLVMFAALGIICEHRWPRPTRATLYVSAAAISLSVLWLTPQFETYRGLSGIDSALFGLLAVMLLGERRAKYGRAVPICLWLLVAGFVAKISHETWTASTFFVDSQAADFVPVPSAHAVGFGIGAAVAVANLWKQNRESA